MNVTDVVDAGTLQELNRCLAGAVGMSMMVVDADGVTVASDSVSGETEPEMRLCADWDSPEPAGRGDFTGTCGGGGANLMDGIGRLQPHGVVVPVEVGDQRIATWYVGNVASSGDAGRGVAAQFAETGRTRGVALAQFFEAPAPPALPVRESAIALVSVIARIISDAASANLRRANDVDRYLQLALSNAVRRDELQRITNAAPVGLIEVSRGGDIEWTNRQAELLLGMTGRTSDLADSGPVCTVSSIDDSEPASAYTRIARRLARGQTVRNIRCVLSEPDGAVCSVRVDATPQVSPGHRLQRVVLAILPEHGQETGNTDSRPSWNEVRTLLNVANTRSVTRRADLAQGLQRNVVDLLQRAWVDFDSVRQDLAKEKQPDISGAMDTIAFQLQEATANAAALASACWPNVWDHHGVASAIEWRLGDMESNSGFQWSFNDRSNGQHSLEAARCTVLYHVAEELLSDASIRGRRADVVLDANEHYWLLVISVDGVGATGNVGAFGELLIREQLRPFDGTIETIPRNDGRVVRYVIMPAAM